MREHLADIITPAYEAGKNAAKALWDIAGTDEERDNLINIYRVPEDVMTEAWRCVPDGLTSSESNWFVEGFCRNWAQLWFDYRVSQFQ